MAQLPTYRIVTGGHLLQPTTDLMRGRSIEDLTPAQARGDVWLFESPLPGQIYVIGVDLIFCIDVWSPVLSTDKDFNIDNAAISVWRIGKDGRDYQIAEYT